MKKLLFFLFLLIPFLVSAQTCKVTKGDGTKIGDEIKCGTESFYLIEHNENNTRMIAKYNLLVGDFIDYIEAGENVPSFDTQDEAVTYCNTLATGKNYTPYYVYPMFENNVLQGCRIYQKIEYEHVLQDERAVGTKLVDGKSQLPLYGITYMEPTWGYEAMHDGVVKSNVYDANGDLVLEGSSFKGYLDGYKTELERQEINVEKVSFITLSDTLRLLKAIYGQDINVVLDYTGSGVDTGYVGKMDIINYAGNNKWIYDVTYWLGSGFKYEDASNPGSESEFNDYYISNEGSLCAIGRGQCSYLKYPIGNGVRPVITVKNTYILLAEEGVNPDTGSKEDSPDTGSSLVQALVLVLILSIVLTIILEVKNRVTNFEKI